MSVPGTVGREAARMKSRPGHLRSSMERNAEDSERGRGGLTAPRLGLRLALFLKVMGGREPGRRSQPERALTSLCCWCRVDGPAGDGGGSWWRR